MTFDATVGGASSNSYTTFEDAVLLIGGIPSSPGIVDWLGLSTTEQEQTLVVATVVLNSLNWAGCICNCEQRLQWPRRINKGCQGSRNYCLDSCETIIDEIKLATAYMAAFMGEQGGFTAIQSTSGANVSPSPESQLEPFQEVQVGPIKVKMKEDQTYGDEFATNLGQIPPFVADLIKPFLNAFGMTNARMFRTSVARAWSDSLAAPAYSGTMRLQGGVVYPRFGGWASNTRFRY